MSYADAAGDLEPDRKRHKPFRLCFGVLRSADDEIFIKAMLIWTAIEHKEKGFKVIWARIFVSWEEPYWPWWLYVIRFFRILSIHPGTDHKIVHEWLTGEATDE